MYAEFEHSKIKHETSMLFYTNFSKRTMENSNGKIVTLKLAMRRKIRMKVHMKLLSESPWKLANIPIILIGLLHNVGMVFS